VPDTDRDGINALALREVLAAARDAGFLGPGPIERHLVHAEGFVTLARAQPGPKASRLLDLGSGGGLPGLVVARAWPEAKIVLLEANERRAQFLVRAVVSCGLQDRVEVVHERAEIAGRDPSYRGVFDGVLVRSFGPPAVVAECAAPLLRIGGWLLVSEPPSELDENTATGRKDRSAEKTDIGAASTRWPADELVHLGLEPAESVRTLFGYQILRQIAACPDRFPRRNGVPSKRPLF
jgi:16S rRNA (guanine527-N7)-methyltransferase